MDILKLELSDGVVARVIWGVCLALLLVGIILSALNLVERAHMARDVYKQIDATQQSQDELLAEHSRLLLERSAIASMQNVEMIAQTNLDMKFPEHIAQVLK